MPIVHTIKLEITGPDIQTEQVMAVVEEMLEYGKLAWGLTWGFDLLEQNSIDSDSVDIEPTAARVDPD